MGAARLRQVFHHLLTGESEKQVAAKLAISVNTLHHRAQDVYRHLGVDGRIELLSEMLRRLSDESRRPSDAAGSTARRKSGRKTRLSAARSRRMKK